MTNLVDKLTLEAELIRKARELAPVLANRVPEADALRKVPDQTIADFHKAGFFRMLQPARYGGYEVHPNTYFEVQTVLGAACPSSAWIMGVVGVHNWQLALFDPRAQDDVWGKDASTLISSSYAPTGKVERVEGGFRVSGRWSFSSGCDHCQWVFLGGFAPPEKEGGAPDMRTYLLPRADYTIEDNWHVIGLKGTGSKDIVVNGAFVPEYRTHKMSDGFRRKSPGHAVNTALLYKIPFGQIFVRSVSTTAIGIAQGALNAYLSVASKRIAAGDQSKVSDDPTSQLVAARAAGLIDECKLVLRRNFNDLMARAEAGDDDFDVETRVKYRYESANVVAKAVEAVDGLFSASGGRAIFLNSPLLRFFLDIHAARAHHANNPEKPGRNYGGVQLGLKTTDYFL